MSERVERLISVFTKSQPLKTKPYCCVDVDAARELVHSGLARWDDRCRAVRFVQEEAECRLRDASCQMGPRVIERAAMGSAHHVALCDAWRPKVRFG